MRRGFKVAVTLALVLGAGVAVDQVLAACQGEGPYELRQCGARSWFEVPPGGPGTMTSFQMWQLGFGRGSGPNEPAGNVARGDGFGDTPLPGVWWGNDNALLDATGIDLRDASTVPGVNGPVGSLCFSSASNWGAPGVDGCPDNDRTYAAPVDATTPPGLSDGYLNTYTSDCPAVTCPPNGYYYYGQRDAPMAVLLKEANNTHFALAFVANRNRMKNVIDFSPGFYDFDAINNGVAKPAGGNASLVPWQPIPQLSAPSVTFQIPGDTSSPRIVTLAWPAIQLVHDNSTRPAIAGPTQLGGATGVGVLDQGPLARYQVETAPVLSAGPPVACGAFVTTGMPLTVHPATGGTATVPQDTCLRLRTIVGRSPSNLFLASPATITQRNTNRFHARRGALGDVGYEVMSRDLIIGGALVSDVAVLKVADRNKNAVTITFDTPAELNVTSFDVVGKDARGERVLAKVNCKECNSGRGASYTTVIPAGDVKGSKSVQIVAQPSGTRSNELPLRD